MERGPSYRDKGQSKLQRLVYTALPHLLPKKFRHIFMHMCVYIHIYLVYLINPFG